MKAGIRILQLSALLVLAISLGACASSRKPVPPGVVPTQAAVLAEDEKYGHEVLSNLTERYPLDRDDARILRVRDLVEKLTRAAKADNNPWHVYVLVDDNFKNAAATRGNYIFVWTGILRTVQNDAELATILSHEIGHVLAGHTESDPAEETNRIIAGIAGIATSSVLGNQGLGGPASDLAELIVRASLEALLVNPDTQDKELEADQIGLFMMADAGFDPAEAINFWQRIQSDPDFRGFPLEFLSSHPSSLTRVERLSSQLPAASERYRIATGKQSRPLVRNNPDPAVSKTEAVPVVSVSTHNGATETWEVMESSVKVFASADSNGRAIDSVSKGVKVSVVGIKNRWLEINQPVQGYVQSKFLAPVSLK